MHKTSVLPVLSPANRTRKGRESGGEQVTRESARPVAAAKGAASPYRAGVCFVSASVKSANRTCNGCIFSVAETGNVI
jgi:hypothetical protein